MFTLETEQSEGCNSARKVFVYVPRKEEGVQMQSICKLADTKKCYTFCLTFYSVFYSTVYFIFFHTSEKSVMWRNLSTGQIVIWGNSSHVENNSPQEKCEENRLCGAKLCTLCGLLSHFILFSCNLHTLLEK